VTPYGWEGNRRSGVVLAVRHRLRSPAGSKAYVKEDEHLTYTPKVWLTCTFTYCQDAASLEHAAGRQNAVLQTEHVCLELATGQSLRADTFLWHCSLRHHLKTLFSKSTSVHSAFEALQLCAVKRLRLTMTYFGVVSGRYSVWALGARTCERRWSCAYSRWRWPAERTWTLPCLRSVRLVVVRTRADLRDPPFPSPSLSAASAISRSPPCVGHLLLTFSWIWRSWRHDVCIAPFRENVPLKRSEWHVLTRNHTVLPATHTFIPNRSASPHCGQYSFSSHRG